MCVFCNIVNGVFSSKKVYEDDLCIAILDLSQQGYGHTLVIPKEHYANMLEIPEDLLAHLIKVTKNLCNLYTTKLKATGFNILNNCNEVAGQTVLHFHIHIIPRYDNDNNKLVFLNNVDKLDVTEANNGDKYNLDEILNKIIK